LNVSERIYITIKVDDILTNVRDLACVNKTVMKIVDEFEMNYCFLVSALKYQLFERVKTYLLF